MTRTDRQGEPRVLERSEHPISRKLIDRNAVKVLYRLQRAGFMAFLVGGSVRDLMLGIEPKDFDVATDARPEEVGRLFRNSRVIGRRFRLVHVFFREGIVELSTFRRIPDPEHQKNGENELLITSDNAFGTPREDAFRRDFGVNALFYNIDDFSVIDYVGGLEDLDRRLIRVIGDPAVRFQEDPVRMLRACEFAARLGFGIETRTQEGIYAWRRELEKASPARVTEEIIQLLRCGHAGAAAQWMSDLGLLQVLLPELDDIVDVQKRSLGDFSRILPTLDRLTAQGRTLSDAVLLGSILMPRVLLRRFDAEGRSRHLMKPRQLSALLRDTVEPFVQRFQLSRARGQDLIQALDTFQHFGESGWSEARQARFSRRPSFPDAVGLLEVMVEATGAGREVLEEWAPRVVKKPAKKGGERDSKKRGGPRRRGRRRRSSSRRRRAR